MLGEHHESGEQPALRARQHHYLLRVHPLAGLAQVLLGEAGAQPPDAAG